MLEHPNRGFSFEDFLKEEGIPEASTTIAMKGVLAWQIAEAMSTPHLTKSAMAARMHTSRSQLERLLEPEKTGVSLETIHVPLPSSAESYGLSWCKRLFERTYVL